MSTTHETIAILPRAAARAMPPGWPAALMIVIGLGLWGVSMLGLEPGNVLSQRFDLLTFHLPSAQRFAELAFLDALADYPAAPFPLFYMLAGAVLALGGTVFTIQAASVGLGLVLLWLVHVQAHANRGFPRAASAALVAAVLVSPYFRGTTVYANTDPLSLVLLVAAFVLADRPGGAARRGAALALACLAVWTRQFYLFLPAALFLREAFSGGVGRFLRLSAIALTMGLPVVALVLWWGGPTPPGFRQHITSVGPATTVPVILSVFGLHALPLLAATLCFHRAELLATLRRPAFLAAAFVLLCLGAFVALGPLELAAVDGGGAVMIALARLGLPGFALSGAAALITVGVGCYGAYLVLQAPRANAILLVMVLAFVPTSIIYQRYFDPLLPILFGCVLRTRESESLARSWLILLYPGLELALTVTGQIHYGAMLAAASAR